MSENVSTDAPGSTVIYGYSDDLIEVEGPRVRGEVYTNGDITLITTPVGIFRIRYDEGGVWRITPHSTKKDEWIIDHCSGDPDDDNYTDRLYIYPLIGWVVVGGEVAQ